MNYNFYIPKNLEGVSPLIWEQKTDCPSNYMMLPEFNIDLVFNLDRPWTIHSDYYKEKTYNPTESFCFLSGLHTKPLLVEFESSHLFGIRLNTVAASLLFNIECKEVKNWSVEGDTLFGRQIHYMQDKVFSIPDFHTRARWLESFITSFLHQNSDFAMAMKISTLMDELSDKKSAGKHISIENYTGYSRMHTLRIFQKWFGVAPGEALRFRRFEKAMSLIHHADENLTHIGLHCGYFDQSHFIREFKKFTGMKPLEYVNLKSEMPGHFSV